MNKIGQKLIFLLPTQGGHLARKSGHFAVFCDKIVKICEKRWAKVANARANAHFF